MKNKKYPQTINMQELRFRLAEMKAQLENENLTLEEIQILKEEYDRIKTIIQAEEEKARKRAQDRIIEKKADSIYKAQLEQEMAAIREKRAKQDEQEIQDLIQAVVDNKDRKVELADRKQDGIDTQIGNLIYQKEDLLHKLYVIKMQQQDMPQTSQTIQARIEEQHRIDEKLAEINKKLEKAKQKKAVINDKVKKEIIEIVLEYNKEAKDYGLEKDDLPRMMRQRDLETEIYFIEIEQQNKYRLQCEDNCDIIFEDLQEEQRSELEEESTRRLEIAKAKSKKDNSLAIRGRKFEEGINKKLNFLKTFIFEEKKQETLDNIDADGEDLMDYIRYCINEEEAKTNAKAKPKPKKEKYR